MLNRPFGAVQQPAGAELSGRLWPDSKRSEPEVAEAVAKGDTEIGIGIASDAKIVPGLDPIPLPTGAQSYSLYVEGVSSASKDADAAKALIAFLTSPAVKQAFKANGFE